MHGANATGRPFTGDYAGILLYQTLYDLGLASSPVSESADDGLELLGCRITNAVRCVPPQNKPVGAEINQCRPYLIEELDAVPRGGVLLALGKIAHDQVIRALGLRVRPTSLVTAPSMRCPVGCGWSIPTTAVATTRTRAGSPRSCSSR